MDPITSAIVSKGVEKGLARLADELFTAAEVGLNREDVLARVAELEAAGHTPDQIADDLATMRKASSAEARAK